MGGIGGASDDAPFREGEFPRLDLDQTGRPKRQRDAKVEHRLSAAFGKARGVTGDGKGDDRAAQRDGSRHCQRAQGDVAVCGRNSSASVFRVNSGITMPENSSMEQKLCSKSAASAPRQTTPGHRSGGVSRKASSSFGLHLNRVVSRLASEVAGRIAVMLRPVAVASDRTGGGAGGRRRSLRRGYFLPR